LINIKGNSERRRGKQEGERWLFNTNYEFTLVWNMGVDRGDELPIILLLSTLG
jgi:hypothetical protein